MKPRRTTKAEEDDDDDFTGEGFRTWNSDDSDDSTSKLSRGDRELVRRPSSSARIKDANNSDILSPKTAQAAGSKTLASAKRRQRFKPFACVAKATDKDINKPSPGDPKDQTSIELNGEWIDDAEFGTHMLVTQENGRTIRTPLTIAELSQQAAYRRDIRQARLDEQNPEQISMAVRDRPARLRGGIRLGTTDDPPASTKRPAGDAEESSNKKRRRDMDFGKKGKCVEE